VLTYIHINQQCVCHSGASGILKIATITQHGIA